MIPSPREGTLSRAGATTLRSIPIGRTSRTPIPPALPNRAPAGPRRSAGPAPRSVGTCPASTRRGSSASSSGCIPRAGARSIHARRPPSAGGGRSGPACPASRGDGGGTGIPGNAPLCGRRVPASCPCRGRGPSTRTAPVRPAPRRGIARRSPRAPFPRTSAAAATATACATPSAVGS